MSIVSFIPYFESSKRRKKEEKEKSLKSLLEFLYRKYQFKPEVVPFETFVYAVNVETEHVEKSRDRISVEDAVEIAVVITRDHFYEYPNYYDKLKKMEEELEEEWKDKEKPEPTRTFVPARLKLVY